MMSMVPHWTIPTLIPLRPLVSSCFPTAGVNILGCLAMHGASPDYTDFDPAEATGEHPFGCWGSVAWHGCTSLY